MNMYFARPGEKAKWNQFKQINASIEGVILTLVNGNNHARRQWPINRYEIIICYTIW